MPHLFAAIVIACLAAPASLRADTRVDLLETWPAGDDVVLGRNQNFYLRIAYSTDAPTRIWARPYLRGEPARAGSNASVVHDGEGEAIGWFFLSSPSDEVDEIRIETGDGTIGGTATGAVWRGHVRGREAPVRGAEPAWVATLNAEAASKARRAREAQAAARTPADTAADNVLLAGFMLAVAALAIGGIAANAWALARWRGGWRIAAAIPAAGLAFVMLRIMMDTTRDPTSHNLWPFEIVHASSLALLAIGAMAVARVAARRR